MTLNGKPYPLPEPTALKNLLEASGFDNTRIAVMLNGEIVPRAKLNETTVFDDDCLEIVSFVGGG